MRTAIAVFCIAVAASVLAASAPGSPATNKPRVTHAAWRMIWRGSVEVGYTAFDDTPFDIQRAGYTGCSYTQNGDTLVSWKDVWIMKATIVRKGNGGRLTHQRFKRVSGPVVRGSRSHIQGSNENGNNNTQCSDSGVAGTFNCTAATIKPASWPATQVKVDDNPHFLDFDLQGYFGVKASYAGTQPSGRWTCANDIGTNSDAGGFVAEDADLGILSAAAIKIRARDLVDSRTLISASTDTRDGDGWSFPMPGLLDSCAPASTDEICQYVDGQTTREAELRFERIKTK